MAIQRLVLGPRTGILKSSPDRLQRISCRKPQNQIANNAMNSISSIAGFLAKCALLCSILLLLSNLQATSARSHVWLSSLPLALVGAAYAILQIRLRPNRWTLLKRMFLAGTFILWAVDQFLPEGRLAMAIGDAVVAGFVLDLWWLIQEQTLQTE
jgi:hypothetical protein